MDALDNKPLNDQFFQKKLRKNTNAVYVSKVGNDSNDGLTIATPKLTIAAGITVASNLLGAPTNATGVSIHVLDGGTYYSNAADGLIDIPAGITVDAVGATVVGNVDVTGGATFIVGEHYPESNGQTMLTMNASSAGPAIYKADVSDGRGVSGTLINALNVRNNGGGLRNLFVSVGVMYVTEGGTGIGDFSFGVGHIHLDVRDLYLAGNNAVGVRGGVSGPNNTNTVGFIEHILEFGTITGSRGIYLTDALASVKLVCAEIIVSGSGSQAYEVTAGELYLVCPRIVGTQTGNAIFQVGNGGISFTGTGAKDTTANLQIENVAFTPSDAGFQANPSWKGKDIMLDLTNITADRTIVFDSSGWSDGDWVNIWVTAPVNNTNAIVYTGAGTLTEFNDESKLKQTNGAVSVKIDGTVARVVGKLKA